MLASKKTDTIVGLDFEAGSIAATEVQVNGSARVTGFGVVPLAPGILHEGEVLDPEGLGEAIKTLFAERKLTKTARLGIANQRVAVRTLRLPLIESREELEAAIRFQAQDQIPMPLDQAVLDWEVVGHHAGPAGERQIDVVVVAARRDMISALVTALRSGGVKPAGIDLSAFGMIRALGPIAASPAVSDTADTTALSYEERVALQRDGGEEAEPVVAQEPTRLFCSLGEVLNLAVATGTTCLFTRVTPFGIEGIAQRLAERRRLTLEHARQWLVHVGLDEPVEAIEGNEEIVQVAREALDEGATRLADEIRKSLEYYDTQEGSTSLEEIVVCGSGTTIPGLVARLQSELGHQFVIGRPAALGHLDDASAARLTLSYGLALEQ
jgi:type IV pilus assembly protein PilM